MIRILTAAALAAALAAPAMAGESIRIATAGKSPEQLKAEVAALRAQIGALTAKG